MRVSVGVFSAIGGGIGTAVVLLGAMLSLGDRGIWFTRQEGAQLSTRVAVLEVKQGVAPKAPISAPSDATSTSAAQPAPPAATPATRSTRRPSAAHK